MTDFRVEKVLAASAYVASIQNNDGTLTISPTTGAAVASINLNQTNFWSASIIGSGYVGFSAGLTAGSSSTPTSMLENFGGTSLRVKRATSNLNLDNTATQWLLDASNSNVCTGTPTFACSHWANQTDCEQYDAHGGCSWSTGSPCSNFNYEGGMTTCGMTSGCSTDTTSCAGAGDQMTCEAQDDPYGGSCSWGGGAASYCDGSVTNSCDAYMDEGTCVSHPECSWDGMSCSNAISACSTWDSDPTNCAAAGCTYHSAVSDSCTGSYNTGICSGTYGAGCVGTSSCTPIDDSSSCGSESGCTWSTILYATLPDGETCQSRTYWIYNDSPGGADIKIFPYAGQTVDLTSSYTLASYKDRVHLAYYKLTADCSTFNNTDQTTCENNSGCSWSDPNCSGTYTISKNWYKF